VKNAIADPIRTTRYLLAKVKEFMPQSSERISRDAGDFGVAAIRATVLKTFLTGWGKADGLTNNVGLGSGK